MEYHFGQDKRSSVGDIKKRWNDLRRRTKEKLAFNRASANHTGGGPVVETPLTPLEETVQLSLSDVQIRGVKGIDTLDAFGFEESCQSSQGN